MTALLIALTTASYAAASGCDINDDGTVNVLDSQEMVAVLQGADCPRYSCDVNIDGSVDVADFQAVHNDVLGVEECIDLADLDDMLPGGFDGNDLPYAYIDVDVDGDLDFFVRIEGLAVSDMTSDLIYQYGAAVDLDGDGEYDAEAPIDELAIDPDGWEPIEPGGWFGFVPDAFTAKDATWELSLAVDLDEDLSDESRIVVDMDGDAVPDWGFRITHVVGELF